MRSDMHKVIVERPRWTPGPDKYARRANLSDELQPKFEGVKRMHTQRKGQRDLLGPLHRWLHSKIGRPWNDVYREACAVSHPDNYVRLHVKTHLLQFVERNTFMHNGTVCVLDTGYRCRGIIPVTERRNGWNSFYVHPENGLLLEIPRLSRRARQAGEPKPAIIEHWIGKNISLRQIRGLWFECHFERPDNVRADVYDHALERVVRREELSRYHHRYLLCVHKRQLSTRELRRHGLQNVVTGSNEAQSSVGRVRCQLKTALRISVAVRQTTTLNLGGRMANQMFDQDSSFFRNHQQTSQRIPV